MIHCKSDHNVTIFFFSSFQIAFIYEGSIYNSAQILALPFNDILGQNKDRK